MPHTEPPNESVHLKCSKCDNLENNCEKYHLAIENRIEGVWVVDTDGYTTFINQKIADILGYTVEEVKAKHLLEFIDSGKGDRVIKNIKGCKEYIKEDTVFYSTQITTHILDDDGCNEGAPKGDVETTQIGRIQIYNRARMSLLNKLRDAKSVDKCLELGCRAIYEAELFRRSILTLHNSNRDITNIGWYGLEEEVVEYARNMKSANDKMTRQMFDDKFRVSNSYFIPTEVNFINTTTGKCVPQEGGNSKTENAWKRNDKLFVPLRNSNDQVEGWLSVDRPFNGERPTQDIVLILEEILDLVASKIRNLNLQSELKSKRKQLLDKEIALRQILKHLEVQKDIKRNEIVAIIEQSLLPAFNRLANRDNTINKTYYNLILKELKQITTGSSSLKPLYGRLSPREVDICKLVRSGCTSKEIAELLHISVITVNKHRNSIRRKLGLSRGKTSLASFLNRL